VKLLLVDDDLKNLEDMRRAAGGDGRNLAVAKSLTDAIGLIHGGQVDVLVTDLALRGKGDDTEGLDLVREAQKLDRDMPVLLITAYPSRESFRRAIELGVFDVVDRQSVLYEPQAMLRHKINLAVQFREGKKRGAGPTLPG
jgi:CheY-like chemotaxis protein